MSRVDIEGTVLVRFRADFPGVIFTEVFEGMEEIVRLCSCLLKASAIANNDKRACKPSPATLATTSLELAALVLREVDDVVVDAGAYDFRAEMMWLGVTIGTGPSRAMLVDALEAESMAPRRTSKRERTSPA